jgi:hypothetical protein
LREPVIHRFPAEPEGAFVNAYLVETASGVVAVDGLLQVSAAREMRAGSVSSRSLRGSVSSPWPDPGSGVRERVVEGVQRVGRVDLDLE